MAKIIECTVKPYDDESAQNAFRVLFCNGEDREDGLIEIPADSLQLVVSALEYIRWDTRGEDREIIKKATAIVERLRDQQKTREWNRKHS